MRLFSSNSHSEPHLPNGATPKLISAEDWRRFFVEELKIPREVSEASEWTAFSAEDYRAIYQHAGQRMLAYPYKWAELTLLEAFLLLWDPARFQAFITSQQVPIDNHLLYLAARLSTLEIIQLITSYPTISKRFDSILEAAAAHNTYETFAYLVDFQQDHSSTPCPYLSNALYGNNLTVAARLIAEGVEIKEFLYTKLCEKGCLPLLRFLAEHDSDAQNRIARSDAAHRAFCEGHLACFKYLVEEQAQKINPYWLELTPRKNTEELKQYVKNRLSLEKTSSSENITTAPRLHSCPLCR